MNSMHGAGITDGAVLPSRRQLMSGCIASLTIASGPVKATPALSARAMKDDVLVAEASAYFAAYQAAENHPGTRVVFPSPEVSADQEATLDRMCQHFEQMIDIPAQTLSGLQAKARVLMRDIHHGKWPSLGDTAPPSLTPSSEDFDRQESLIWSICADLLRMSARAA
jgi:hypothetical protein